MAHNMEIATRVENEKANHRICIGDLRGTHVAIAVDITKWEQIETIYRLVFEIVRRIPDNCSVSLVAFNTFQEIFLDRAYRGHAKFMTFMEKAGSKIKFGGLSCYADVLGFECDEMYLITSSVQIPPRDAKQLVDLAKCQVNTICVGDGHSDLLADIAKGTGGKHGKMDESGDAYKVMKAVDMVCDTKVVATCLKVCLLYTSPSPRDRQKSRMAASA